MNWRDLLYFSKGERRALTLLAALIAAAWLLLLLNESPSASFLANSPARLPEHAAGSDQTPAGENLPARGDPQPDAGGVSDADSETAEFFPNDSASRFSGSSRTFRSRAVSASSVSSPSRNAGHASSSLYPRTEKFPPGTVIELNGADTLVLKKVPGIGSAFARRIVKYRRLLGGFYSVDQLSEVYGIDEEQYTRLYPWFRVEAGPIRPIRVNGLLKDTLFRHPYLTARQLRVLRRQLRQKGKLRGWENLSLLEEFTEYDRKRLTPYFSFE